MLAEKLVSNLFTSINEQILALLEWHIYYLFSVILFYKSISFLQPLRPRLVNTFLIMQTEMFALCISEHQICHTPVRKMVVVCCSGCLYICVFHVRVVRRQCRIIVWIFDVLIFNPIFCESSFNVCNISLALSRRSDIFMICKSLGC